MGFVGNYYQAKGSAKAALAEGDQAAKAYYANAKTVERDARGALDLAGQDMVAMRKTQNEGIGRARSMQGASGFSSEGTGSTMEANFADTMEHSIRNAMVSTSVGDADARHKAAMLRWSGDTTMVSARNRANAFNAQAKGALVQGAIQVAGMAVGGLAGAGALGSTASSVMSKGGVFNGLGGAWAGWNVGGLASSWAPGSAYGYDVAGKFLGEYFSGNQVNKKIN